MGQDFIGCICADARQDEGYREALGLGKADVLLTDPPYCLLTRRRKGGDEREPKGRKIEREPAVRFESVREYRAFTEAWLPKAISYLSPGAPLVIWTNFLGKEPLLSTARTSGYGHLAGEFVWAKRTTAAAGNEQILRVYEVALVILREAPPPLARSAPAIPWAVVAGYDDDGEAAAYGSHPHHKPFGVLDPLVRTYVKEGGWVLEPFAGSGSIPAAALRLGRQVACLELMPEWAQRTTQRMRSLARSVG